LPSFATAIAQHARIPLYFSFGLYINFLAGVPEFNAEAYVPAQSSSQFQDSRFSYTNENKEWTSRAVTTARQGAQARLSKARISRVTGLQVLSPLHARQDVNHCQKQHRQKFPRSSRLLKHADFQSVYKTGRKYFAGNITAFYRLRNDDQGPRIGFTVGKVLGGAVERNRIRRRLRAAVQRRLATLSLPLDIVLHPRKSVQRIEFVRLEAELEQIFAVLQKGAPQKGRPA
jgi:ribonuclease P protein component